MSTGSFNPFAGGEIERVAPSTFAQREVIASSQMSDEANTAFNEGVTVQIQGLLDTELFEQSFQVLIDRHESFRSTFSRKGDEICLQTSARGKFEKVDLRSLDASQQKGYLKDLYHNISISPMNLEEGPLFFAWLVCLGEGSYQLVLAAHHVVCDGWSFGLLLKELEQIYAHRADSAAMQQAPSFLDYAERQSAAQIANKDVDFWRAKFSSLPPNLDLPLDFKRPSQRTFTATRMDYVMGGEFAKQLKNSSSSMKVSVVNLVLSAYAVLLHRLTGNEDVVIGLPVAGQVATNNLSLVGHMVQLLPIRVKMDAQTPFSELLKQVKSAVLDASEHPNFTYGELIKGLSVDRSRVPLISTIFNMDQKMPALHFGEAIGDVHSIPRASENFEMFLNIVPKEDELVVEVTYSTVLFRPETISSWMGALEQILLEVFQRSDIQLGHIALAGDVPNVSKLTNKTDHVGQFNSLIEAVELSVKAYPQKEAIACAERSLDYQALWRKVERLAAYLAMSGVEEGQTVGVCCDRSEQLIVATLALHRLGAAYLPLDPSFPKERLRFVYQDAGAVGAIVDDTGRQALSGIVDTMLDVTEGADSSMLSPVKYQQGRLAYIIYTSGSTGKPKGVEVSCKAMINFLEGMLIEPGFDSSNVLLAVTTLAFDISVLELFLPLIAGGKVVIAEQRDLKDGESISELLERHQVDVMQSTPATFHLLLASSWGGSATKGLKALCGGEPMPSGLAEKLIPRVSELWNMYGPTEATVWVTRKLLNNPKESISVGKPINNTRIYIVDDNLHPVPLSVPGELCIAGENLAVGYHGRQDLTNEKFIEHPALGRVYRTGDLAKWNAEGEIVHLGRIDDQVKVRGYRIELGEIEQTITQTKLVQAAAAYIWKLSETDIRIVVCCIALDQRELPVTELRKFLRAKLPSYMIPQYFLRIDEIPLSSSGKVDRKALPRPKENVSKLINSGELSTETEKTIAQIWADLVKPGKALGPEDSFFEIGGHSLLALEAIRQIEAKLGVRLNIKDLISSRLGQIASEVEASLSKQSEVSAGPIALSVGQERPLSGDQLLLLKQQLKWPDMCSHNVKAAWQISGDLDLEIFQAALRNVFERQTALRTVIRQVGDQYVQRIATMKDEPIVESVDCSSSPDALSAALNIADDLFATSFGLLEAPLYRLALYRLAEHSHLFVFVSHQVVFDGWSYDVFLRELSESYEAILEQRVTRLAPLPYEFRDYSEWLNCRDKTPVYEESLAFHRQSLPAHLNQTKLLEKNSKGKGVRVRRAFTLEQYTMLRSECDDLELREHELFFAILVLSISQVFERNQVLIGVPVTGRYLPDVINLVGSFVSTLPLNVHIESSNLQDVISSIASQLKTFYQYQEVSLADVIEGSDWHDLVRMDELLQLSFSYQNVKKRTGHLANLSLVQSITPRHETELPMEAWVRVEEDGFVLFFDYDSAQVPADLISRIMEAFEDIVTQLSNSDKDLPSAKLAYLEQPKKSIWRRLFS